MIFLGRVVKALVGGVCEGYSAVFASLALKGGISSDFWGVAFLSLWLCLAGGAAYLGLEVVTR